MATGIITLYRVNTRTHDAALFNVFVDLALGIIIWLVQMRTVLARTRVYVSSTYEISSDVRNAPRASAVCNPWDKA